jgi:Divergent InlB B-repeat domain
MTLRTKSLVVLWTLAAIACGDSQPMVVLLPPVDEPPIDPPDAPPDAPPDEPSPVKLTVETQGTGSGTVISNLGGIDCGADCTEQFDPNTVVTLTAAPDSSSLFLGWTKACTGTAPCVVTMDQAKTVSAEFALPRLVVTFDEADGNGSISSDAGLACDGTCEGDFPLGTTITLFGISNPLTNSALHSWNHPSCSGSGPCTITLTSASTSVGARFGRNNSVDNGTATFAATKHGDPAWDVAGFQTASIYNNNNFFGNVLRLWENHAANPALNALFPSMAHGGPYDTEVAQRFAALGWDSGDHFRVIDWSSSTNPGGCAVGCNATASGTNAGRMLVFAGVIVPNAGAPIGSTRDYASGPILPRDLALSVDADLFREDVIVDPDFDGPYPTLSQLDPSATEDGESHKTLTFADGDQYIPTTPGNYRLHVHVFEIATPANGWHVDIPFVVDP